MNPTQKPIHTPGALADLTPADILRCAARYLELRGWTQGNPYEFGEHDSFPPACTLGAIATAVYGHPVNIEDRYCGDGAAADLWDKTVRCLADFLWHDGRVPDFDSTSGSWCATTEIVADWNDDATQTLPDVLDILRTCADDHDWTHATEDDLETYADACVWAEKHPTRDGFLAWRAAQ
ncbi:hypothetical protein [Micromonospora sp. KC213]|uniref:DUF6197 family protein n=1 Tax=Micromonospora sp. KC213 TaxID=2530378 RepID=UPI0010504B74|nr:hypothetical protein [Micromonospora sp. KC213]TDC37096.1 hypothetical protein E1166_20965 [Micromonospora sp. KC213]